MQAICKWLLALSIVALLIPLPLFAAGDDFSGSVELGGTAVDFTDSSSRVNEYISSKNEDGANATGKFDLSFHPKNGVVAEATGDLKGARNQQVEGLIDLNRIFKGSLKYNVLEHRLDHDRLDYMDAALVRGGMNKTTHEPVPIAAVTPDLVPAFVLVDGATNTVLYGSDTGDFSTVADGVDDYVIQTGGASMYAEDLVPEQAFSITRKEWKADAELTVPAMPNVTFDVGYRNEKREGTDQSISMSKCSSCHVTGESKEINETTEDFTAGVTGKFGLLTVRYEFLDRKFDTGPADTRIYDSSMKPGQPFGNTIFDDRITYDYDDGLLPADTVPESEKQSHLVKARVDLEKDTTLIGSYVTSKVESNKTDEPGIFTLNKSKITTTYDGYGLKATTRFGKKLKVSARIKAEKIDTDDISATFQTITAPTSPSAGITYDATNTGLFTSDLESLSSRDVLTARLNAVYRLAAKTTLRLKYEYENEDRDDGDFSETTAHTYKASINTRLNRKLSLRASYTFEDIDNPFHNPEAALVPVGDNILQAKFGVPGYIVGGNSALYGTTFYDAREADLTNQPEKVHQLKVTSTWAPKGNFAATLNLRYKDEENDLNHSQWEQQTYNTGLTFWYAPTADLNFTMAYNYFDQRAKTAFCQGFYDG